MTLKLLTLILALGFLTACEQLTGKKDDPAPAIQRIPDPIPVPQPPPPLPHPEPPPPILTTLPTVSFAFAEWKSVGGSQLTLELTLSQPTEKPVSVDIILADGTALYPEDYTGFEGSSANDLKITVNIPPNTSTFQVPPLLLPAEGNCDVEFTARLNKDTVENAIVTTDTSTIKIPCL